MTYQSNLDKERYGRESRLYQWSGMNMKMYYDNESKYVNGPWYGWMAGYTDARTCACAPGEPWQKVKGRSITCRFG